MCTPCTNYVHGQLVQVAAGVRQGHGWTDLHARGRGEILCGRTIHDETEAWTQSLPHSDARWSTCRQWQLGCQLHVATSGASCVCLVQLVSESWCDCGGRILWTWGTCHLLHGFIRACRDVTTTQTVVLVGGTCGWAHPKPGIISALVSMVVRRQATVCMAPWGGVTLGVWGARGAR